VARVQIRPDLLDTPVISPTVQSVRESRVTLELDPDGDGVFELEATPGTFEETRVDRFSLWWEDYKKPASYDRSHYPGFLRGAWASRLDEARSYLLNAETLRSAGVDTVMLGIDVVFDPETGEPRSLGDDAFIFYLQALKKAGFRVVLIPNPMHPNLDMGLGFEWNQDEPDGAYYRPSAELLSKFSPVVMKWAEIAETYDVYGFAPLNEPSTLVRDYQDASRWLQEILPGIKKAYRGRVIAVDTMYDIGQGLSAPYPYDYRGYDMMLGSPPAGRQDREEWEAMLKLYIQRGMAYAEEYSLEGFGLYEWGGYTGGVWYEEGLAELDQLLTLEQAHLILEAGIRQAEGNVIASLPRISTGWVDLNTPAFKSLAEWYGRIGNPVKPFADEQWTLEELVGIEKKLAGADYEHIFQLAPQQDSKDETGLSSVR